VDERILNLSTLKVVMVLTRIAKLWCPAYESEPAEGEVFNRDSCPWDIPENWFQESPAFAAELYAKEMLAALIKKINPNYKTWAFLSAATIKSEGYKIPDHLMVRVIDEKGTVHEFNLNVRYELSVGVAHKVELKE